MPMVKVSQPSHTHLGKVEIAPEVITVIASIATAEVKGLQGHFKELKQSNFERVNTKQLSKDVKVYSKDDGIYIDVYCVLEHDVNISKTSQAIQRSIFNSLTTMIAVEPSQINIHITHIA